MAEVFEVPKEFNDLGFGSVVGGTNEKRLLNRDGSFNPRREGLHPLARLHPYHLLLTISWRKFIALVISGYVLANVFFALLFLACGPNAIGGQPPQLFGGTFGRALFLSVETFGTIGYGNIYPMGIGPNMIIMFESLTGLFTLALGTGILFARFSRPTAAIIFSQRAVVAPYHGKTGLMFRLTNKRMNQLIELEAKVLFSRVRAGARIYDQLSLERTRVVFFPLSWTIVHPIDEKSPMYGMTHADFVQNDAEFLVLLSGIDETFSQTVHARTSYKPPEIVFGHRFVNIYNRVRADGTVSIDVRKLGRTEPAPQDEEEEAWDDSQSVHHTMHFSAFAPKRERRNDDR
ncbi:MAG TPA: ion channel [Gemmatimonadaceae bacterium]|jgi:inward rectifier potassium channel|nr:ion channel [Gemmatimonadaceae bacterium]